MEGTFILGAFLFVLVHCAFLKCVQCTLFIIFVVVVVLLSFPVFAVLLFPSFLLFSSFLFTFFSLSPAPVFFKKRGSRCAN